MSSSETWSLVPSRSGEPSATVNGRSLHSAYNPDREASRYLDQAAIDAQRVDTVIVVGPGLGYLLRCVRRRFPEVSVLALFVSARCWEHAVDRGTSAWHPGSAEPLTRFLSRELAATPLDRCALLTWPPVGQVWPSAAHSVEQSVLEHLREHQASTVTEAYFGARWLRNLVSNLRCTPPFGALPGFRGTVLIAASGPTLEQAIPAIRVARGRIRLWALPSAVAPLCAAGLTPDMVVLTDPGFYAARHLSPLSHSKRTPIAMPLTAARGIWHMSGRIVPFQQQLPFEDLAYGAGGIPALRLSESGTVAGSALELALRAGFDRLVFAGLDLCSSDLTSHARPDMLLHYRWEPHRFRPLTTVRHAELVGAEQVGFRAYAPRALGTYAGWFRRQAAELQGRLFRLMPSPVELGIPEVTGEELHSFPPAEIESEGHETEGSLDQAYRRFNTPKPRLQLASTIVGAVSDSAESGIAALREGRALAGRESWLLRAAHLPSVVAAQRSQSGAERKKQINRLEQEAARLLRRLRSYLDGR